MFISMNVKLFGYGCLGALMMAGLAWPLPLSARTPGDRPVFPDKRPDTRIDPNRPARAAPNVPYHKTIKKQPETAQERRRVLNNLYAHLATAPDAQTAQEIASTIESLWYHSGSDTISVLLERANVALARKELNVARELLDAAVELAPDFAEAWNRRAVIFFLQNDYGRALGDLRRAIALEPNHFKALDGLGRILRDVGKKRGALEAFRMLKSVHPFYEKIDETIKELELEVEGRGI